MFGDYVVKKTVTAGNVDYVIGQNTTPYGAAYMVWQVHPKYDIRCGIGFCTYDEARSNLYKRVNEQLWCEENGGYCYG